MSQPSLFTTTAMSAPVSSPDPSPDTASFVPPPCLSDKKVTIDDMWWNFSSHVDVSTSVKEGDWYLKPGEFGYWDRNIECGKSYMVGDNLSMERYLKTHTSPLSRWQKAAYDFVIQNPNLILHVETKTHDWHVYLRGEYVEFALPYHGRGGERNYVSRNGRSKVLVNVD